MEVSPGFKKTDVGVIPENWDVKTLFDLAERKKELFDDGDWIESEHITSSGIRLIQTGNIGVGCFIEKEIKKYIYEKSFISLRCKQLQVGDLLVCRLADPAGRACVLPDIGDPRVVTSVDVTIFRPPRGIVNRVYLSNVFSTPEWFRAVSDRSGGTTHKRISRGALGRIAISIPPYAEQLAIADALGDVDELLGGLERLITKKRNLKQAAMQQLLTGQTRLPGFSDKWTVNMLGDKIEKIIGGGTPSRANLAFWGNEIPWVTVKDFATFTPRQAQESITRLGLKCSASHLIAAGTLITSTRMALGKAVIYDVEVAINQDLKAIFWKPDVAVLFMRYWFEHFEGMIDDLGSGSTVKGISIGELRRFPCVVPSFPEQTAIAEVLSDMDAEIAALEQRGEKTRNLKQAMMQELLTGKTRLIPTGATHA